MELIVELQQGRAQAVAALPGFGDIGTLSWRSSQRCDDTVRPRAVLTRTVARLPVGLLEEPLPLLLRLTAERIGITVGLAHQVHQDALAQATIGHAHHRRLPLLTHRLEDGAAGQGE